MKFWTFSWPMIDGTFEKAVRTSLTVAIRTDQERPGGNPRRHHGSLDDCRFLRDNNPTVYIKDEEAAYGNPWTNAPHEELPPPHPIWPDLGNIRGMAEPIGQPGPPGEAEAPPPEDTIGEF